MIHYSLKSLILIWLIVSVVIAGVVLLWLYKFIYHSYIPEREYIPYIDEEKVGLENETILIYGADSSLREGTARLSDNPRIYEAFVNILLKEKKAYGTRLEGFVHGGDFVSHDSKEQFDKFLETSKPLINNNVSLYLSTGNEEGEKGRKLLSENGYLANNKPYYVEDFTNFDAIILNTELALKKDSKQYAFLENQLKQGKDGQFIVFMHHPFITYGFHNKNKLIEYKRLRFAKDIEGLFLKNKKKIIAVVQSDDHDYQRLDLDRLPVFVSGGLGEGLRETGHGPETEVAIDGVFHFIKIQSNKTRIVFSAIRINDDGILGKFDRFEINLSDEGSD